MTLVLQPPHAMFAPKDMTLKIHFVIDVVQIVTLAVPRHPVMYVLHPTYYILDNVLEIVLEKCSLQMGTVKVLFLKEKTCSNNIKKVVLLDVQNVQVYRLAKAASMVMC